MGAKIVDFHCRRTLSLYNSTRSTSVSRRPLSQCLLCRGHGLSLGLTGC